MPTRYQMNVPQHPDDNYSINKAFDRNYGNRLKSGDTTPLKYTIKDGDGEPLDKDRLMGMETTVKMKHEGVTAYEAEFEATLEEVSEVYEGDLVARYKIMEALPPSDTPYIVEFHFEEADDRFIFPSGNNLPLYITPSALNSDEEAIKKIGEERLKEAVESSQTLTDIRSQEQERITAEKARQTNYLELVETGVVRAGIDHALAQHEQTYAPRLTSLEQNDTELTTQLDHIENSKPYYNVGEFGAVGDGIADDKVAIQNAINYCASNNKELVFDNNKTYLCYSISVPAGIKINGNGATLKKPNLSIAPYNMSVEQMKWIRLFDLSYNGEQDSPNTIIENLNFDGNCWEMWEVEDGYAQEQASLFIVQGNNSNEGRLNVTINNCSFSDNVSDGAHIVANVKANISNCKSRDCFRGGLTITGGNSTINVSGFIFESIHTNDGIDIEIDSPGYNGSMKSEITLNNIIIDKDLDIAVTEGSVVTLNNAIMKKSFFYFANSGELYVNNSSLKSTNTFECRLVVSGSGKTYFSNVKFEGINLDADYGCLPIQFYQTEENSSVNFYNCSFYNGKYGISGGFSENTKVIFGGCYFDESIMNAIGGPQDNLDFAPKELHISNCIFANTHKYLICNSYHEPNTDVYINDITISNEENTGMTLTHPNVLFNTILNNGVSTSLTNAAKPTVMGKRILYVDDDPNILDIWGFKNCDMAILKNDTSQKWEYSHQEKGTPWNHIWTSI